MTTKEFIESIASGELSFDSDILKQAARFPDRESLIWDLKLAEIVCMDDTGKPIITTDSQIRRVNHAIAILCEETEDSRERSTAIFHAEILEKEKPNKATQSNEVKDSKSQNTVIIPEDIANNETAMEILNKFKDAGLLDENFQKKEGKWPQLKVIAQQISIICDFDSQYQIFEKFWNYSLHNITDKRSNNQKYNNRLQLVWDILEPYLKRKKEGTIPKRIQKFE